MNNREIVDLCRKYTVYEWTPQAHSAADPVVAVRSKGVHFWDADGKRYIDFSLLDSWAIFASAKRSAGLHYATPATNSIDHNWMMN